jgi:hypothetical protein
MALSRHQVNPTERAEQRTPHQGVVASSPTGGIPDESSHLETNLARTLLFSGDATRSAFGRQPAPIRQSETTPVQSRRPRATAGATGAIPEDRERGRLIDAWDGLPDPGKAGILAMAQAASKKGGRRGSRRYVRQPEPLVGDYPGPLAETGGSRLAARLLDGSNEGLGRSGSRISPGVGTAINS